jgi:hypothetical protein
MNTTKLRLGFLLALSMITTVFSAFEETEAARAEVTVLQEYTATQGKLLQTGPLQGAEVRFFGPLGRRQDLEAIEISDSEGEVYYEYQHQALIPVEVMVQGVLVLESHFELEPGESTQKTIVVPE